MQVVMSWLKDNGYFYERRENTSTNELEDLFFAHPRSLELWRAFPHVVLMDATYNTNRYGMPLLEIVGVIPTNMTFSIAFVYMHKEKESNYTWALDCLKSTMVGCISPRVIVTDRELALMKACSNVFPTSKGLLCRWHIYRNVLRRCQPSLRLKKRWNAFYKAWTNLVESETVEAYRSNFIHVEESLIEHPDVLRYINKVWLTPYKEMFVSAWTDKYLNFGNHTTNRVESQHAKVKQYVNTSQSDIMTSLLRLHEVVHSQDTAIKASIGERKIVTQHRFNQPHFQHLRGFVSNYALAIILKEYERSKNVGLFFGNCGCQVRTSYSLPCADEQAIWRHHRHECAAGWVTMYKNQLDDYDRYLAYYFGGTRDKVVLE